VQIIVELKILLEVPYLVLAVIFSYKACLPRYTVGSRQAKHKL